MFRLHACTQVGLGIIRGAASDARYRTIEVSSFGLKWLLNDGAP